MDKFIDERDDSVLLSIYDLEDEFNSLQAEDAKTYSYSFSQYLENCLGKDGTIRKVESMAVCDRCLDAINSHEGHHHSVYMVCHSGCDCDFCGETFFCGLNLFIDLGGI